MMVTFVSQCEKKALKKTRRVLDAFANRIGDNTWQTVITKEGLQAIHNLLKKTASKSTAVSCHWIRSRSRSELLWIVGKRHEFNEMGYVPVNYTNKNLIMDLKPMKSNKLFANTRQQPLYQHLFAVGFLAYKLMELMKIDNVKLKQSAFIAGILHDLGKVDPKFQTWVNKKIKKTPDYPTPDDGVHIDKSVVGMTKFTFEKHPRHHEISWLFSASLLTSSNELNPHQIKQIYHAIYWHHTKPYRKNDKSYFDEARGIYKKLKSSLNEENIIDKTYQAAISVLKNVSSLTKQYDGDINDWIPSFQVRGFELTSNDLPFYKQYDELNDELAEYQNEINLNAQNNLIRAAVISADRMVSSLDAEDLGAYINEGTLSEVLDRVEIQDSNLTDEIRVCLQGFEKKYPNSTRNQSQTKVAKELADLKQIAELNDSTNISVLQGPAGCGKTKIALEWATKTKANKIIWICPRVQVCLGLLNDLTQSEYLPQSRIEIFTGEFKKILTDEIKFKDAPDTDEDDYFSGDIVITTIDQIINAIITHQKVDTFIPYMQSHVVFDEFHELALMPAFNLLFAELIAAKNQQGFRANTLLLSATPNYFFVNNFLEINPNDCVTIESFNQSKYQIDFHTYDAKEQENPLVSQVQNSGKTTFVITNTAEAAQIGFLKHQDQENNVVLHSKYTKQDKAEWFERVFNCFKKNGNHEFEVLRSGPIVQASLNITCDAIFTELTSAENWLQRLGRLDRFGKNSGINIYTTVLPESAERGKQDTNTSRFLNQLNTWRSTVSWLSFLKDKLDDENTLTLNKLYQIYKDFYQDESCLDEIKGDFLRSLKKSVSLLKEKIMDPISVPSRSKVNEGAIKISKSSLRGDNRFVQMAVCEINNDLSLNFPGEYTYDENIGHTQENNILTESVEKIRGYGDSAQDLVAFMKAKHHNIKTETKKAYKDFQLINEARSPEYPIYLSYTPEDLEPVGGIQVAHPFAIYYVTTSKQPVGAMSIFKLQKALNLK